MPHSYYLRGIDAFRHNFVLEGAAAAEELRHVADELEAAAKNVRRLAGLALETPGLTVDCEWTDIWVYSQNDQARLDELTRDGLLGIYTPEPDPLAADTDDEEITARNALDSDVAEFSRAMQLMREAYDDLPSKEAQTKLAEASRILRALDGDTDFVSGATTGYCDTGFYSLCESGDDDLIDEDPPQDE